MRWVVTGLLLVVISDARAQEPVARPEVEQQLENQTALTESVSEDDSWWQQEELWRKHPININQAGATELEVLPMLTPLQVSAFLQYRRLMGRFTSVYELQAVPGWDTGTIRKLLPYIIIGNVSSASHAFAVRWKGGEHSWLGRVSGQLPGIDSSMAGNGLRLFTRYRYQYKQLLQYGITADKDAGEGFFTGQQKAGFDFYSFHCFVRQIGIVRSLALGDFTVNMGQGLLHWQTLAFKKSAAAMLVKRQGDVLRPYNSAGEFNFHRGAGITLQQRRWGLTLFGSVRKLDANLVSDSVRGEPFITSIQTYGLHRTPAELQDRHSVQQVSAGGSLRYGSDRWHAAVNIVQHRFSHPFKASAEPYDLYGMQGDRWSNYSMDYSYTWKSLHVYGEWAVDRLLNKALLQGLMISLHPKADLSVVYRNISKGYQSLYGNAFTESYAPNNECGLYTGVVIRPAPGCQVDAYADVFRFPWLRYRVDAPGNGAEYLLQLQYIPEKKTELSVRYRYERKPVNTVVDGWATKGVEGAFRHNWRFQTAFQPGKYVTLKSRVECVRYQSSATAAPEYGFSVYSEIFYRSMHSFSASLRLHYFDVDSYNAGVYAYEQDVQYAFSIPLFQDKGFRFLLNIKQQLTRWVGLARSRWTCTGWLRGALTTAIGKPDSVNKTGYTFQLLFTRH